MCLCFHSAHHFLVVVFLVVVIGGHFLHVIVEVCSGLGELVLLQVLLVAVVVDHVPKLSYERGGGTGHSTRAGTTATRDESRNRQRRSVPMYQSQAAIGHTQHKSQNNSNERREQEPTMKERTTVDTSHASRNVPLQVRRTLFSVQ